MIREAHGLTLTAAARGVNIDPAFLHRVEHGKKAPNLRLLAKLAALYNTSVGVVAQAAVQCQDRSD
jgi:transcriptional regulator with XRE-family HTH domain